VTGPVSKDVIASSGARGARGFLGHTEHLAKRLGARREPTMAFWSPRFTTALVTTHLPLSRVPRAVTSKGVTRAVCDLAEFVTRIGVRVPRLVVAGLNPHAGEAGRLGREEIRTIAPGVARARARLGSAAKVMGPIGAESAFRLAVKGQHDGVVAMYHDQATIPMKLLVFGEAVNVTLGLPIVRTSVDHGTAYDQAGKGTADAAGMHAAIELAIRLTSGGTRPTQEAPSRTPRSRTRSA
jgi:4-hydroxythreonine-4-phosphate dehydrogenase